jgi:uncharacterized protein YegP (UPF0339 family)
MSMLQFRHTYGRVAIFGLAALSGTATSGALPDPGPPPDAQVQVAGGRTAAAQTRTRSLTFEIYQDKSNQHRWRLNASNGQIIATSGQGYKDKRDAKNAIERIKADAATKLKFETYADAAKEYRWRLKATNGQVIATSGQGYKRKTDCEHAILVIKAGAKDAKISE